MRWRGIELDARYSLLTLASLAAVYWLSSRPDFSTTESSRLWKLVSNLSHAPLFAGLTFCVLRALSFDQKMSWREAVVVLFGLGTAAALDEWHQVFVPGRKASVDDFLLDIIGIAGMLLIFRIRAPRETNP
jgi:VanZ family protein